MERRIPIIHNALEKAKSYVRRPHSQPRQVREKALHTAQSAIENARIGLIDPPSDDVKRKKETYKFRAASFGYAHAHPAVHGIRKDTLKRIAKQYSTKDSQ